MNAQLGCVENWPFNKERQRARGSFSYSHERIGQKSSMIIEIRHCLEQVENVDVSHQTLGLDQDLKNGNAQGSQTS